MRALIGIICILGMIGMVMGIEILAAEDTLTATVQAKNISVIVQDGVVAYGILQLSDEQDTLPGNLNDQQDAGNNGNTTADFDIKSSDAVGGTQWALNASTGSDLFIHKYSTDDGSNWRTFVDDTSYDDLGESISASASQSFDLWIGIPSASTDYQTKTITVTVLATES